MKNSEQRPKPLFVFSTKKEVNNMARNRRYTGANLLVDVFLTLITGGLWLIVLGIKFLGRNS
jgi:hypothetical protein